MTRQEHELMIGMFTRLNGVIAVITETLKSREIWTGNDEAAFSDAVHSDPKKMGKLFFDAMKDYQELARSAGVVTGLEI